jgi:hypothetical protein
LSLPLTDRPDAAWLPVDVTLDDGGTHITWMDLGNSAFAEPFFDDTYYVQKRRRTPTKVTSLDALRAAADASIPPAGFIFHMSRCGSTLLSQMLKEISGVRVYSEPRPVNAALLLAHESEAHRDLVRAMIRALCLADQRQRIFKFSSWTLLHSSWLRELFPDVPTVFVIRKPADVLASIAKSLPGFVEQRWLLRDAVRKHAGDRTDTLDDLEFAAVVLRLFLDAIASAAKSASTRVVDYTALVATATSTLPAFFGIEEKRVDVARMEAVTRFHAKALARVPFEKEQHAPDTFEPYVSRWIGSRYDELLAAT